MTFFMMTGRATAMAMVFLLFTVRFFLFLIFLAHVSGMRRRTSGTQAKNLIFRKKVRVRIRPRGALSSRGEGLSFGD